MAEQEIYLRSREVRARYGGCSDMWLHRRLNDPTSGFPKPVYFGRQRFWRLSDLLAWEAVCETRPPIHARPAHLQGGRAVDAAANAESKTEI